MELKDLIDYDTETYNPGCSGCQGHTDEETGEYQEPSDYCRCSTIESCKVRSFDKNGSEKVAIAFGLSATPIKLYVVERILNYWTRSNFLKFEWQAEKDYYGEVIKSIKLEDESEEQISKLIHSINSKTEIESVLLSLNIEYQHLLPSLGEVKNAYEQSIELKNITVSNKNRLKQLKQKYNPYQYVEPKDNIFGIVRKAGKEYQLIDGYTRYSAIVSAKKRKAVYVVLE